MNRQQRRLLSKQQKQEDKVKELLKARLKETYKPDDIEVELYFTVFGLALEELYGFKTGRITKVWKRADEYVGMLVDKKKTFEELKQDLRDRANVECSFH